MEGMILILPIANIDKVGIKFSRVWFKSINIIPCYMNEYQKYIYENNSSRKKAQYCNIVYPSKDEKNTLYDFNELFKYNSKLDKYSILQLDRVTELFSNIDKNSIIDGINLTSFFLKKHLSMLGLKLPGSRDRFINEIHKINLD